MNRKNILLVTVSVLMTLVISIPSTLVFAEQSGNSPESGVTSRIKQAYDSLVSLGYGSDESGAWGDWGSMWNRIRSAAEWTPDGTATSGDVVAGETFYGNSRTKVTGTAVIADPIDFEQQALVEWDDYEGPGGSGDASEDYMGEESTWTNTATDVWKDERTGLYWSKKIASSKTNQFPNQDHSTCPFFDGSTEAEKLAARYEYDGLSIACGYAINTCGSLEFDADGDGVNETNWYLPTQKELQQAYLDGMFNQTSPSFTTEDLYWSSSEDAYSEDRAWYVYIYNGYTFLGPKTYTRDVRCVRQD